MHVCLRLWKYDYAKRMCCFKKFKNVSKITKKMDLWIKIVRQKQDWNIQPPMEGGIPRQCKANTLYAAYYFVACECSGHSSRLCCHVLPYSSLPHAHSPSGAAVQHRATQNHWEPGTKHRDTALKEPQLGSSCSPQPASLRRASERKSTPAPFTAWTLIVFSCRDTKYLCKQHVQIVTCKRTCDNFMKYANMTCWAMIWSACVFESLSHALVRVLKISDSLFKVNRANLSAWFITSTSDKYDLTCSSLVCF